MICILLLLYILSIISLIFLIMTLLQYGIVLSYSLFTLLILLIKIFPPLNNLLLHGKALTTPYTKNFTQFLVNLTVPKYYFNHYYYSLTVYQLYILTIPGGYSFRIINLLLLLQGIRRAIEGTFFTNYKSNINVSHYILGMIHYLLVSISTAAGLLKFDEKYLFSFFDTFLILYFIYLSFLQHKFHLILSKLVKYTLPPLFLVSSPHYLYECQLYLVLLLLSRNSDWLTIFTFFTCFIFVLTNLAISAGNTWTFYKLKFADKFTTRYAMIPGIY